MPKAASDSLGGYTDIAHRYKYKCKKCHNEGKGVRGSRTVKETAMPPSLTIPAGTDWNTVSQYLETPLEELPQGSSLGDVYTMTVPRGSSFAEIMSRCPKAVSAAFGFGGEGRKIRRRFEESAEEYVQRVTRELNISDEEWASAVSMSGVSSQDTTVPTPRVRQCETREYGSASSASAVDTENNGTQTVGNTPVPPQCLTQCLKQVPPRAQQAWGDGVRVRSTAEAAQRMHAAVDEAISALSLTGTADKLQALTGAVCAMCSMSAGFDESRFVNVPATGSVGAHVGSLAQGFGGLAASP